MKLSGIPKRAGSRFIPLAALICSLALQAPAPAVGETSIETRYVKPTAEVVVRRGQGNEFKIIGMVKDGESVDFLEESGSYARIRFRGKEGWMLKRYLSAEPPLGDLVASLKKERDQLAQANMEVEEKAQQLSMELSKARTDFNVVLAERDQLAHAYQNLKNDTANVLQMKSDLERATSENAQLQQDLAVIGEKNKELKKEAAINWFLAGGGVLLVGMLIGRMAGSSRRRKSSLM